METGVKWEIIKEEMKFKYFGTEISGYSDVEEPAVRERSKDGGIFERYNMEE